METRSVQGIMLHYDAAEAETADLVAGALARTVSFLQDEWAVQTPADCRAYVMTSGTRMIFHAAPRGWKLLLGVTYPLWAPGARRRWQIAGGWAQRFGRRATIGIKPARLLEVADGSIGRRIWVPDRSPTDAVSHNTCHELTHAWTDHLRLPAWLHEGIAMVSVDRAFETETVQAATLDALERTSTGERPEGGRRLDLSDPDAVVYQVVRGYWFVRYIEETRPGLLRELLARRRGREELEGMVASALGESPSEFWVQMDARVVAHFRDAAESS